eukprot:Platyproteum_vivax@DN7200_c0_g1_i5.p1
MKLHEQRDTSFTSFGADNLDGPIILPAGTVGSSKSPSPSSVRLGSGQNTVTFYLTTSAAVAQNQNLFVRLSSDSFNFTDAQPWGPLTVGATEHTVPRLVVPKGVVGPSKIFFEIVNVQGETQEALFSSELEGLDGPSITEAIGAAVFHQKSLPNALRINSRRTAVRFYIRTSAPVGQSQRLFVRLSSDSFEFPDPHLWGPLPAAATDHMVPRHIVLKDGAVAGPTKITVEIVDRATEEIVYSSPAEGLDGPAILSSGTAEFY